MTNEYLYIYTFTLLVVVVGVYIGCTCGKVGAVIAVMLGIVSVAGLLTYGGDVKTPANATAAVILGVNHELL